MSNQIKELPQTRIANEFYYCLRQTKQGVMVANWTKALGWAKFPKDLIFRYDKEGVGPKNGVGDNRYYCVAGELYRL